jgi:hypothetical protein
VAAETAPLRSGPIESSPEQTTPVASAAEIEEAQIVRRANGPGSSPPRDLLLERNCCQPARAAKENRRSARQRSEAPPGDRLANPPPGAGAPTNFPLPRQTVGRSTRGNARQDACVARPIGRGGMCFNDPAGSSARNFNPIQRQRIANRLLEPNGRQSTGNGDSCATAEVHGSAQRLDLRGRRRR